MTNVFTKLFLMKKKKNNLDHALKIFITFSLKFDFFITSID